MKIVIMYSGLREKAHLVNVRECEELLGPMIEVIDNDMKT
jgi:hypothetical protein